MNCELLIPLLITTLVVIIGWYVVHFFTAKRDQENKKREIRVQYLIEAFRLLANASQRKPEPNSQYFRDMESAVADIQLLGTESQIESLNAFLKEFASKGSGSLDDLLSDLRNDLRHELKLPEIKEKVRWFRPEGGVETNG
jgi:hypothetical protein